MMVFPVSSDNTRTHPHLPPGLFAVLLDCLSDGPSLTIGLSGETLDFSRQMSAAERRFDLKSRSDGGLSISIPCTHARK